MKHVIDASFVLAFLLPDEQSSDVIDLLEKHKKGEISFVSPFILPFEVANGLKYAVKAKRINESFAIDILNIFFDLEINQTEISLEETLKLSLRHELSIYDAAYLWLSESTKYDLLSLDKKLMKLSSRKN